MISNGINLARSSQIETLFSEAQMHTFEICLYISTYRATNTAAGAEILVPMCHSSEDAMDAVDANIQCLSVLITNAVGHLRSL
jgi:hypothetical protein